MRWAGQGSKGASCCQGGTWVGMTTVHLEMNERRRGCSSVPCKVLMTISLPGAADPPLFTLLCFLSHNTLLVKISVESRFLRGESPRPGPGASTVSQASLASLAPHHSQQRAASAACPQMVYQFTSPPWPLQLLHPRVPLLVCSSKSS